MNSDTPQLSNPLVSVIAINYNGIDDTLEFLASVVKSDYKNLEVIIVDNASKEDPTSAIVTQYPGVKVYRSEQNLGFAGGNNLGLNNATGELIFFVNNDTILEENTISALVERLTADPKCGGVSPKILYCEQKNLIQFAGFTEINPVTGRNKTIGEKEIDNGQYNTVKTIPYLHGAAMMIKKEVIDVVGKMNEHFFLYYEEMDWSQLIRNKNYILKYEPAASIYHKESASVSQISNLKLFYMTRNRLLFINAHSSSLKYFLFMVYFLFVVSPLKNIMFLLKNDMDAMRTYIKAVRAFLLFKRKGVLKPF